MYKKFIIAFCCLCLMIGINPQPQKAKANALALGIIGTALGGTALGLGLFTRYSIYKRDRLYGWGGGQGYGQGYGMGGYPPPVYGMQPAGYGGGYMQAAMPMPVAYYQPQPIYYAPQPPIGCGGGYGYAPAAIMAPPVGCCASRQFAPQPMVQAMPCQAAFVAPPRRVFSNCGGAVGCAPPVVSPYF